ncbi:MAG: DUF4358 domain-containing protein [Lachnospiraceae bacterium]|nr:DUF4358 domain-containing protein [Lachnospiraceae bacterium]
MKKLAVLFLTATLILNLAGCGNRGAGNEESTTGSGQQETVTDSTVESESETQSEPGTEEESPQAPEDVQDGISEEMSAVRQAVVDALGENYWPNTQIPAEYLEGYGLTDDMYTDFWGEMPMISVNVDTIIVIKASEGQMDAVEGVLNSYRDALVSNTMQYPMNIGKIQASQVEVVGDYACFLQLGADTVDMEDEDAIRHCQEQNEMAFKAIENVVQ